MSSMPSSAFQPSSRSALEESAEQAADRHALQMRLYALSLEAITGQPVQERLVVMLSYRAVVTVGT